MRSNSFDGRVLLGLAPVAVFFLVSRFAGAPEAIAAGFAASAVVFAFARTGGAVGALTLFGFVIVGSSALAGIVWSDEKVYLASGAAADFLIVPLLLGSIALQRPLAGLLVHELLPYFRSLDRRHQLFYQLTVAFVGFNLLTGLTRLYLLMNLNMESYLLWSRVVVWPMTAVFYAACLALLVREARRTRTGAGPLRPEAAATTP
jgi:intracellular septation protein A